MNDKIRELLNRIVPRLDAGGPNPIDPELHHCEWVLYREGERIHAEFEAALAQQPAPVGQDLLSDEIHQIAFEEGQPAENGDGYLFTSEEFDLFVERLLTRHSAASAITQEGTEHE